MVQYEKLYNDVKNILSEERFSHSERVVKRAIEYAKNYNLDLEKVKLVAIAHDIAKEIPKEEIIKYCEKIGVTLDNIEKENLALAHGKIGAKICIEKYGFTEEMANAVKYHTTGRAKMSLFEKIIFLADSTEEGRNYSELDWLVNLVKTNIDEAMVFVLKFNIEKSLENNKLLHPDSIYAYNDLIKLM